MAIKIADLLPSPRKVPTGNGDLEVRGLSLEQTSNLLTEYSTELMQFFGGENVDFKGLVIASPGIVAEVICLASDAVGQEDDARRFPVHVQIAAMTAIWEETIPDIKKLSELLSTALAKVKAEKAETLPSTSTLPPP